MCSLFCIRAIMLLQFSSVLCQNVLPPVIIKHPTRQVAMVTSNSTSAWKLNLPTPFHGNTTKADVKLECEAIGTPEPKYKWKKDGNWFNHTIPNRIQQVNNTGTLLFLNSEDEDTGWYQCFAENYIGTAASDIAFVLIAQNHPQSYLETNAEEWLPFGLKCHLPEGWPKWQVYWIKGSTKVENFRTTVDPAGDLWFSYISIKDASDDYMCVAKAAHLNIPVTKVKLKIVPGNFTARRHYLDSLPPGELLQYVSEPEKIAISGQPTEVACIYGGLAPVTWTKNSEALKSQQHLKLHYYGKILRIDQVQSLDNGNYTCKVRKSGLNESRVYHTTILKVYEAPVFKVKPQNLKARTSDKAVLNCSAFGVPPPRVTWYHNGRPLPAHTHQRRHFTDQSLTISDVTESDMGNYACNASNEVGYVYEGVYFVVETPPEFQYDNKIALAVIASVSGFLVIVVICYYVIKKKTKQRPEDAAGSETSICLNSLDDMTFDPWHFNRGRLLLLDVIGEGKFGRIFLAEALFEAGTGGKTKHRVAVKTTHVNAPDFANADLIHEVSIMVKLGNHCNVVKLIGACTEAVPTYLIMELLSESLHQFLRRAQTDKYYELPVGNSLRVTSKLLLNFAVQTAKGMHHVSSKGIIHRDLATRNILLSSDLVCKISDFGLAREVADKEVYVRRSKGPLPIRWMAPESLSSEETSVKSDVWSYGVVLWELAALGARPYPGKGPNAVIQMVCSGKLMEMPKTCKSEVYDIMCRCWTFEPQRRPDFLDCADVLSALLEKDADYIHLQDKYYREDEVDGDADEILVETK